MAAPRRVIQTSNTPLDIIQQRSFLTLKQQQIDAALQLIFYGKGTPAGVISAPVGALFLRLDGGANTTLYVKESGTGTAGWVAK